MFENNKFKKDKSFLLDGLRESAPEEFNKKNIKEKAGHISRILSFMRKSTITNV